MHFVRVLIVLMGLLGYLVRIPKDVMLPVILTISLTAAYVQDGGYLGLVTACVFALIGYALRRLEISILPFVIGFLLAPTLEGLVRGAFTASGGDPFFLLTSPIALAMLALSVWLLVRMVRQSKRERPKGRTQDFAYSEKFLLLFPAPSARFYYFCASQKCLYSKKSHRIWSFQGFLFLTLFFISLEFY